MMMALELWLEWEAMMELTEGNRAPKIARHFVNPLLSLIIPNDQALGDLIEEREIRAKSSPTQAQIWFAWQVAGSAFVLGLRAIVRIAAFRRA